MRKIHITEKQFNKMGLPKKVRQNLIQYGDGEENKGDYQLSSAEGDLGYSHVVGGDAGAICESIATGGKMISEGLDPNFDITPYINSFNDFLVREGYPVKPFPQLNLDNTDQGDVMIKTGFYLPSEKSVTLFVKDRHPKDILRSYAHEMVHHIQNMEDPNRDWGSGKDLKDDDVLSKLEADAYERGNILFRKWTEELKKHPDNRLNESINIKKALANLKKRRDPNNIESWDLNEATESDVDLSSFKVKDELNPKIWRNSKLDSRVRLNLMDIADDFYDTLGISWVKPEDTIIVGSIANYNWSEFSDIDLHLIIDYDKVDKRKKFVEEFFKSKKKEWNSEHSDIKIFGFPVEVYVQDSKAEVSSSGVYSIDKNEWIKKPVKGTFSKKDIDTAFIKRKAASLMTDIENLENDSKKSSDSYSDRKIYNKTEKLIDKIMSDRREKLAATKNEMNPDNIVYKTLRRNGYLNRLFSLNGKSYDKTKSIK